MWRLRDLVMGRRAPVNFDAITVRPLEPELAADLERLAVPALATNGLRIWSMHAAKFDNAAALARKAVEGTIEPPSWVVFTPHRIKTADGIAATIFEGHKIPVVGGSFADVGFELQILARTHKRKTDVTSRATLSKRMSAKETALQVISKLANDVTWGQITDELYAAAVRDGLDELDRGEGIPHEEVKRQFDSWFTK